MTNIKKRNTNSNTEHSKNLRKLHATKHVTKSRKEGIIGQFNVTGPIEEIDAIKAEFEAIKDEFKDYEHIDLSSYAKLITHLIDENREFKAKK